MALLHACVQSLPITTLRCTQPGLNSRCFLLLCLCCCSGQNVDKLKGNGFMGPCLLYFCCPCFACIFAGQTRKEIREK